MSCDAEGSRGASRGLERGVANGVSERLPTCAIGDGGEDRAAWPGR